MSSYETIDITIELIKFIVELLLIIILNNKSIKK